MGNCFGASGGSDDDVDQVRYGLKLKYIYGIFIKQIWRKSYFYIWKLQPAATSLYVRKIPWSRHILLQGKYGLLQNKYALIFKIFANFLLQFAWIFVLWNCLRIILRNYQFTSSNRLPKIILIRGSFNNYVDHFLTSPPSSCPRSYWMTPYYRVFKRKTWCFEHLLGHQKYTFKS